MRLIVFLKIRKACKILQITDRGQKDSFWKDGESFHTTCSFCRTRTRIGVAKEDGQPVTYCWRCVQILQAKQVYTDYKKQNIDKGSKKRKRKRISYLRVVK